MDRRHFLMSLAATATAGPVLAGSGQEYTEGLVQQELDAGKTVFVAFSANWCSTCRVQERKMKDLKAANPDYEANVSFVSVDWDDYGNSKLARRLNIPRRSTLVVLKGNRELGRIVAGTSTSAIKDLMDTALTAAKTA
ncbi:MAG: thioredoxin family protein [Pseudomonadota bacterium]